MNHYDWLDENFPKFLELLGSDQWKYNQGIIVAHGDKCYSQKENFRKSGIPFEHGVALYLLTHLQPVSSTVRQTKNGWVDPFSWIKDNYAHYQPFLVQCTIRNPE